MSDHLEFDGERFTPENVREIWYEHMHRYAFAEPLVSGLEVLDAACGEGYGAAILARTANSVAAVDISPEAINHARVRYSLDNLEFHEADCCCLPFNDARFDCIVSFETIEHLEDQTGMLAEFKRVLKPSGFLLISSPDKAVYSDQQGFENPHHVRELYADEFSGLLASQFTVCQLFGQKLMFHSAIWPLDRATASGGEGGLRARLQNQEGDGPSEVEIPVQRATYLMALCADSERALPALQPSIWLFNDAEESVYQHYHHEIRKNMEAGGILAKRDQELAKAREALSAVGKQPRPHPSWWRRLWFSGRSRR